MKITLLRAEARYGTLAIRTGFNIFSGKFLSPEARRLLRIVYMYNEPGGSDMNGRTGEMNLQLISSSTGQHHVSGEINTHEKLQAKLDKYADSPMRLTFGQPQVFAVGGTNPGVKKNIREVREARKGGSQITVQVRVTSAGLALLRDDNVRFEAAARGYIAYGPYTRGDNVAKDDPSMIGKISLIQYLHDDSDPFAVAKEMIAAAKRIIV